MKHEVIPSPFSPDYQEKWLFFFLNIPWATTLINSSVIKFRGFLEVEMPQVSVITLCSNNKLRFQKSCTLCSHHVIHDAELMETDTSGKQSLPDKVKCY